MSSRRLADASSRVETVAIGLGLAALFAGGYFGVSRALFRAGTVGIDLATPLDRSIPYAPVFAYAYALGYVQVFLPPFFAPDLELFRHAAKGVTAVLVASFCCFLVFPARVPYPPMGDAAGEWILRKNALFADHGFNAFPSLHVSLATFAAISIHHVRPRWRGPVWCSTILIAVSTLFVKRHVWLDLPSGALLGWAAHHVFLTGPAVAWRAARTTPTSS